MSQSKPEQSDSGLIARAGGDDVIVPIRMRRASFERMTSTPDGRSVEVGDAKIGLVPDEPATLPLRADAPVWTFVVWSGEPTWSAAGELIPGNEESARAAQAVDMRYLMPDDDLDEEDWRS